MNKLRQLEKRLKRAALRKQVILIAAGIVALLSTALGLALLLSLLAALFIIPVPVKLMLMVIGLAGMIYIFHRYLIGPFRVKKGTIKAALEVEKKHPELKGRLVAALQFRDYDLSKTNFSSALIDLTGRQAFKITSGINFNEIVSGYPLFVKLRSGLGVVILATILGFLAPGIFSNAIEVYSQPTALVAPPPGFRLEVFPGNAERVKYSDIEIGGSLIGGGFPDNVEILYRFAEGRRQSERLDLKGTKTTVIDNIDSLIGRESLPFKITLKQVRRSLDYYVVAGGVRSETYAINVVERPRITNLKVTISYPSYTNLKPLILDENNGSFAALVGSRAGIEIEANREIDNGCLVINDSLSKDVAFKGSHGEASLLIEDDFSYFIRLHDRGGEENPDPIEYQVTAVPDEYPVIDVLFPGFDVNLDENMLIPFRLNISDDFGFSSLLLKYQIVSGGRKDGENVAVINYSEKIKTEGEVGFNWDLEGFNLLPSDYILYHFELADNDRVSGPKVTGTRVYAARLPSIDEIVMQAEMEQEGRVLESEMILRQQQELVDKLEHMTREMRNMDNIDWQKKKELENIVNRQQKISEQLDEMARQMKESIENMEKNKLLSEQIFKKLTELQKLFSEVATPEMKEAIKKMQEALRQMSPEDLERAMKDFQISQDEMLKRLERSVELLKRMQVQQKMSAMLRMAEETLLEQNRINVETEESRSKDDHSRLAQREHQLQKQMEVLKNEADELTDLLKESPYRDSEEHKRFPEIVKENQAEDDMAKMEQALNQNEKESAHDYGQASSEKLTTMVNQMRKIINDLAEQEGENLAKLMRQAIDDANYLSQEQEELHGQCAGKNLRSSTMGELAVEQQILREAVNGLSQRINGLAKNSPFLSAEIHSYLEESKRQMSGACDNLGERRARASLQQQRDAIYNLNRASIRLLDGLENQKQCNRGGSCNKMGMKLQSMCQKQNRINQQTKGSCPKPGENPSPSQRDALKRLAAEQGSVRKSLQELQAEFGHRREILGRLDALSSKIRNIEDMLTDGQAGEELLNRQLRVYSRMLDLQKSLTRRDYTRERKAATAEDILRASPGPLEDDGVHTTETLQERLNRYLQEGYPRQYEQHIKAYFKSISNMAQDVENR